MTQTSEYARRKKKRSNDENDLKFLNRLEFLRMRIANSIYETSKENLSLSLINETSQRLLMCLIIIRFAEDKLGTTNNERLHNLLLIRENETKLSERLSVFFKSFNTTVNSNVFNNEKLLSEIECNDSILLETIKELCQTDFSNCSVYLLVNIYEKWLGEELVTNDEGTLELITNRDTQKSDGVYYTPKPIIDYIIENTLKVKLDEIHRKINENLARKNYDAVRKEIERLKMLRVVDPSCGAGSFLIAAQDAMLSFYNTINEIIPYNDLKIDNNNAIVYGIDIDSRATEITKLNLWLNTLNKNPPMAADFNVTVKNGDTLTIRKKPSLLRFLSDGDSLLEPDNFDSEFLSNLREGFDLLIGNPPYFTIKSENVTEKYLRFLKENYRSAQYQINSAYLFIEKSIGFLKEDGMLGFIVPISFLMNIYAKELRNVILNNTKILKIVSVTDAFKDARIDTVIVILKKCKDKTERINNEIEVKFVSNLTEIENTLRSDFVTSEFTGGYEKVSQSGFYANPNLEFNIVQKDEYKEIIRKVQRQSVKMGDITEINLGLYPRNRKKHPEVVKTILEPASVKRPYKPVLSGSEISRYFVKFENRYVKFDVTKKLGGCWDTKMHFHKNKIIMRQLGRYPSAALDTFGYACLNAVFMIVSTESNFDIRYILGILNSKLTKFYWCITHSDYKEVFPKIKKEHLTEIPIFNFKTRSNGRKERNKVITLVSKLQQLYSKKYNDENNDINTELEKSIEIMENELDSVIYSLYELNENEITTIEQFIEN